MQQSKFGFNKSIEFLSIGYFVFTNPTNPFTQLMSFNEAEFIDAIDGPCDVDKWTRD
jgi:hypothetical protein